MGRSEDAALVREAVEAAIYRLTYDAAHRSVVLHDSAYCDDCRANTQIAGRLRALADRMDGTACKDEGCPHQGTAHGHPDRMEADRASK